MSQKKPYIASRFCVKAAYMFYGKRYFQKNVRLISNVKLSAVEPPYIVVCNHASFADVGGIAALLQPKRYASFIASATQFVGKSAALKLVGVVAKRQFTVDTSLIRDAKYILSKNRPLVIFPEAKLSVVGIPNVIKPATAKLIKFLKVPLITVCFHGSYLHHPRWAKDKRFTPLYADIKLAVSKDEINMLSAAEIHERIVHNLDYDDYEYQKEKRIKIESAKLAEGLDTVLYKCSECGAEFAMSSNGDTLKCGKCGAESKMDCYGGLSGGRFDSVKHWYFYQTDCVREEIAGGVYGYKAECIVEKMKGYRYVKLKKGQFVHSINGMTLSCADGELHFPPDRFYTLSFNSEHIFLPFGDTVYRVKFVADRGCTSKINLAVEAAYALSEKSE